MIRIIMFVNVDIITNRIFQRTSMIKELCLDGSTFIIDTQLYFTRIVSYYFHVLLLLILSKITNNNVLQTVKTLTHI